MSSKSPDPASHEQLYAQIVAKAWLNAGYRDGLLANPKAVLESEGVHFPDGMQVQVLQDTASLHHFVIPLRPAGVTDQWIADWAATGPAFLLKICIPF